jgi:hypothetical protein
MRVEPYKKRTRHFGIPVPWYGNKIIPEQELRKYQIIENALLAGMGGIWSCVFDDGTYRLENESDGRFRVVLSATGASPAAEGVVGRTYFMVPSNLRWEGLAAGATYYLYVRPSRGMYDDCSKVRSASSTHLLRRRDALLMAVADLSGDVGAVDPEPEGKLYASDLARHVGDGENPHGRTLRQDALVVGGALEFADGAVVRAAGAQFGAAALARALSEAGGLEVIDFHSGGPGGVFVEVGSSVKAVASVHRMADGSPDMEGDLGEWCVGYYGEDDGVPSENGFLVYNRGDAGLPLRAVVACG